MTPLAGRPSTRRCGPHGPRGRILSIGFASGEVPKPPANLLLVKNLSVMGFYWGGYLDFAPDRLARQPVRPDCAFRDGPHHPPYQRDLPPRPGGGCTGIVAQQEKHREGCREQSERRARAIPTVSARSRHIEGKFRRILPKTNPILAHRVAWLSPCSQSRNNVLRQAGCADRPPRNGRTARPRQRKGSPVRSGGGEECLTAILWTLARTASSMTATSFRARWSRSPRPPTWAPDRGHGRATWSGSNFTNAQGNPAPISSPPTETSISCPRSVPWIR